MMELMKKLGLEPKDWLTALLLAAAVAMQWATITSRVAALEDTVKPVPQMRTDIEVVKSAILDIRDDLRDLKSRGR